MKKVQTLNEEIQKMRRLMSFNINENSHDSLSEENFDKSTKGENTDPLQKECGGTYSGPSEIADKMSVKLNKLIDAKLIELQKQIKVNIIAMGPTNTRLEFGDISLPFKENQQYYKTYNFTESSNIPFASDIPVSLFKEELLNSDECFRMVYDRYDSVKNQIDGGVIKMELVPATERFVDMVGNMSIKMVFVNSSRKLKREIKKMSIKLVDKNNINLFDLAKSAFIVDLGTGFHVEIAAAFSVILTNIELYGANIPDGYGETECFCNDVETGEQITYECGSPLPERCKRGGGEPIAFKFVVDASKNFEKDQAILTQAAKDVIDEKIVVTWNSIPQYRKEEYLQFLEGKTVTVNAYASIDALSNFPDGGRYAGCSTYGVGKGPRVDYNQCLSEARANAVVAHLKTIADGAFANVNFVAVGKGETNEWSKLVWDQSRIPLTKDVKSPHSEEELRPDRRFDIAFPEYDKVD
jgi:hypothetical protein